MEKNIVDAVRILNAAYADMVETPTFGLYQIELAYRTKLFHAIQYLSNPDRFLRPKRGSSNVKGGKRRANKQYGPFGVTGNVG